MIGVSQFPDLSAVGLNIFAVQNIVDAEQKTILVVGNTKAVSRFDECVFQFPFNLVSCVGNWRIVKVATDNDIRIFIGLNRFSHHLSLFCADFICRTEPLMKNFRQ